MLTGLPDFLQLPIVYAQGTVFCVHQAKASHAELVSLLQRRTASDLFPKSRFRTKFGMTHFLQILKAHSKFYKNIRSFCAVKNWGILRTPNNSKRKSKQQTAKARAI
ncbi:MAG: hypothetical protein MJ196_08500 [Treponemataceae bacterium]|nr:hypothetical protein [Treponemataceae bacterium]